MTTKPNDIPMRVLREHLADVSEEVSRGRRFIVTRNKRAKMALVPVEDLARLEAWEDARDAAVIAERAGESSESWETVKARLGI
ncbi:MAG: type II toxin-antitoxin system Phd/YefM family antitoxin [Phycisphaerales bacterium]